MGFSRPENVKLQIPVYRRVSYQGNIVEEKDLPTWSATLDKVANRSLKTVN